MRPTRRRWGGGGRLDVVTDGPDVISLNDAQKDYIKTVVETIDELPSAGTMFSTLYTFWGKMPYPLLAELLTYGTYVIETEQTSEELLDNVETTQFSVSLLYEITNNRVTVETMTYTVHLSVYNSYAYR